MVYGGPDNGVHGIEHGGRTAFHRGAKRTYLDNQSCRLGHLDGGAHMRSGFSLHKGFDGDLGNRSHGPIIADGMAPAR